MSVDINNQYTGKLFGQDRIGHTTPDLEASDSYRPWLPVAFPAPYLPGLRQDSGHPKAATKVLSSQMLVGLDKSGALVPAGLFSGKQPNGATLIPTAAAIATNVLTVTVANKYAVGEQVVLTDPAEGSVLNGKTVTVKTASATQFTADLTADDAADCLGDLTCRSALAGEYCILHYGAGSIDAFAVNPLPASAVSENVTADSFKVLAAPADAFNGEVVVLADGKSCTITTALITAAFACDLFPTGVARPIGVATRDVYQYIGGVTVKGYTGGLLYTLDPMNPLGFQVHNYTHEMGTAVQTDYVVRVPWVGTSRKALTELATADGVTGYSQSYGLSFTHFTGNPKNGDLVVASRNGQDAGNYANYDSARHSLGDVCGRVLGVMNMIDKIGYMARVKTLWDSNRLVGPYKDPNTASIMMGGSATAGLPYDINLTTDGLYKLYKTQKVAVTGKPQLGSYVLIRVLL